MGAKTIHEYGEEEKSNVMPFCCESLERYKFTKFDVLPLERVENIEHKLQTRDRTNRYSLAQY